PANSGSSRSRSTAAIMAVTSTCRNSVTCGAVKALALTAAAVCFRTPRTATRSSRGPDAAAVQADTVAGATAGVADGAAGAAGVAGAATAACTSARVMVPSGPVPASPARSTPRSFASFRTGGLAAGRTPARPFPAGGAVSVRSDAGAEGRDIGAEGGGAAGDGAGAGVG